MLINRNIVALFALPFMASATASELSIGAGAAYNESPYRGYNENTKAIPLISYEGDSFYVRQTTLGFILSQSVPGMRQNDNDIGTFLAHFRHVLSLFVSMVRIGIPVLCTVVTVPFG